MKYKNIIFDFGNVLAEFNETHILKQFCDNEDDLKILADTIFPNWSAIDKGSIEYETFCENVIRSIPDRLKTTAENVLLNWHKHLTPITQTWDFIHELKMRRCPIYILSNAPTHFAEHADFYEITKEFDGIIFSAVIKMAKPNADIYNYLFDTYGLKPEESFFLDDRKDNIEAGRALGMEGIIFTGDITSVKKAIQF